MEEKMEERGPTIGALREVSFAIKEALEAQSSPIAKDAAFVHEWISKAMPVGSAVRVGSIRADLELAAKLRNPGKLSVIIPTDHRPFMTGPAFNDDDLLGLLNCASSVLEAYDEGGPMRDHEEFHDSFASLRECLEPFRQMLGDTHPEPDIPTFVHEFARAQGLHPSGDAMRFAAESIGEAVKLAGRKGAEAMIGLTDKLRALHPPKEADEPEEPEIEAPQPAPVAPVDC